MKLAILVCFLVLQIQTNEAILYFHPSVFVDTPKSIITSHVVDGKMEPQNGNFSTKLKCSSLQLQLQNKSFGNQLLYELFLLRFPIL